MDDGNNEYITLTKIEKINKNESIIANIKNSRGHYESKQKTLDEEKQSKL